MNSANKNSEEKQSLLTVEDAQGRLEEISALFRERLRKSFLKPSFFLMACDDADPAAAGHYARILQRLLSFAREKSVPLTEMALTPDGAGLSPRDRFPESLTFRCIALDFGGAEQMRNLLKETLWEPEAHGGSGSPIDRTAPSVRDRLERLAKELSRRNVTAEGPSARKPFRLRKHGLFVPAATRRQKEIRTHTFNHSGGNYYRYRVASKKVEPLPSRFAALTEYLDLLFTDCPDHFFNGDPRISGMRWALAPSCSIMEDHAMSRFAQAALREPRYSSPHDSVEIHLLEEDPGTIACEIPVWLEPGELRQYASLFSPSKPLTGHIDILRVEKGKIEIWDYKSNAPASTHGGLQVFLYAVALSIRTGIPLGDFACGYFDRKKAFVFSPAHPFVL